MNAENFHLQTVLSMQTYTTANLDIHYSTLGTQQQSRRTLVLITASHFLDQARPQAFFDQYVVVWVLPLMTNILVELFSVKGLFVYSLLNTDPTTSTLCHRPKQKEGDCCQHFSCDLCMSTLVQKAAHSLFLALKNCCGNCIGIEMAPSHTNQTQLLFPHALFPTSSHLPVIFLERTLSAFPCC